jgi:hypothetical protein
MTEPKRRGRPPKVVGAVSDPVPGNNGDALERIVAFFQAEFPDDWEALRLCPLQHGLDDMARLLK